MVRSHRKGSDGTNPQVGIQDGIGKTSEETENRDMD
jgi:hypothetical protein